MEEEEIEKAVLAYLKKKGFRQTEVAFQEEQQLQQQQKHPQQQQSKNSSSNSHTDPDVAKLILTFTSESESLPAQYYDGYSKLRSWAHNSLDLYKHELLRVLYPVFIHCFMDLVARGHLQEARSFFITFREDHETMHERDLQKLEGVLSPSHLKEMEFAHTLRQSKVNIKICQYSHELLLQYLLKIQSMLGVVNEHINFQVCPGQPGIISDDADAVTLVDGGQDAANLINQKEIQWGMLEDSIEDRLEKGGGLLLDSDKVDGENKEGENEENKKRSADGGKQAAPVKKSKKDKVGGAGGKAARPEVITPLAPRVKPELTLPAMPTEVEHSILEDLRNRVQLSSVALPSVSFYTFINTHNGLNCASISHDGSLVAGGFSDSSLKVWDMSKLGQQMDNTALQGENDTAGNEHMHSANGGKIPYTLFQGHSGPVYSASFSPLGDFILSSSADSTVRLWSTKLNANLVCYKGHNYPVWDVQFSPYGHYFASCSHDRTARIWSMDRIQPLRIMAGHLSDVDCVRWHVNCNYIATGSSDKTVRLWDIQSGECVRIFIGHRSMVLSLAMSPDGRYMASGDEDGAIMMWDLASGRCITPLVGHTSCVWSLAFSGEGSLLASGSADCTVKLWDVNASTKTPRSEEKTGSSNRLRSLRTLPTKSSPVYSLMFSRRNLLFAAGVLSKRS
ncbi:hypothetical protein SOVF_160320 [Spinacia oleracea]|uniref:Transcription initiation factor TFIID subunit 5 n=1 Tax=Spinacia oleracea TaxID=3562 RepID=A0A9R0HWI0_SPIOL|nr:transcription initiation factor TFIID subunit 5 [Spinacia oleracea]KNA08699.1 hypothetical protein SOVF_160320 [Spinacia oleracea]